MGERISIGALLHAFTGLVGRYAGIIAAAVVALAVLDTALEMAIGASFQLAGNIVSMVASFFLLKHMLGSEGFIEREGSFGRYFGASLLSSLGTIVGLILFVLPGFFLAARWAAATSLAITRDLSASQALAASWALTKPSAGILMLLYIILLTLFIGLVFAIGASAALMGGSEEGLGFSAATNLVIDLGLVLGVVLNVAIYSELLGRQTNVEAVFG